MAFNPLAAAITAEARLRLGARPTVIELGNQSFAVPDEVLADLGRQLAAFPDPSRFALDEFDAIARLPEEARGGATARYYRALGFTAYAAIDVNSRYGSLMMDLNLDLADHYGYREQFDLVTNIGTGEHVFDQAQLIRNMHNLTRPGGLMLFMMPTLGFFNHGFYNFQPGLFIDLARANDYELERLFFANRGGATTDLLAVRKALAAAGRATPSVDELVDGMTGRLGRHVFVVAVLRKRAEEMFRAPIQDMYAGDIESPSFKARYGAGDASG